MQTSSLCKALSVILFILDIIGTNILAVTSANADYHFAFGTYLIILICGLFVGLVFCTPLFALGKMLEYLELSTQYLSVLSHKTTASAPTAPHPFSTPSDDSGWLCSCGHENDRTAHFCTSCGKRK